MADTHIEPLPAPAPMTIYRGDTRIWQDVFTDTTTGAALDLSGHTFSSQIRVSKDDPEILAVIDCDDSGSAEGRIIRTLTSDEAAKVTGSIAYWDYQVTRTSDGFVRTYLAGRVRVLGDVTRP